MTERRDGLVARLSALPPLPPLELICRGAVTFLGVGAAAVVLMSDGESGTVAASYGPGVDAAEDLQFTLGEGPCVAAFDDGAPVLEPDIGSAAERWPAFCPAATAAGIAAVFAVPLMIGAIRLGVLYLTRTTAGALPLDGLAEAQGLAQLATMIVLEQQQEGPDPLKTRTAADGWAHRTVVHQATGMVSAQLDIPLGDALASLRAHAFAKDRSIYDVARDVVDRRYRFTEDDESRTR